MPKRNRGPLTQEERESLARHEAVIAAAGYPRRRPLYRQPAPPVNPPLKAPIHQPGFIYFLSAGETVKIGFSCDPDRRIADIKNMSPVPLTRLGTMPGSATAERDLHRRFAAYRKHGEWFELSEPIKEYIRDNCHD